VIIDLICYRRRGHNEGDDPSMTQPLMTDLIHAKRSTRSLYTDSLVGRGDITEEEYDLAKQDFQERLERAFAETHAAQTGVTPVIKTHTAASPLTITATVVQTAVDRTVIERIGEAHGNVPAGFTVHHKLMQLLNKRVEMSREGGIDWGFGELLALGSLLIEGTPVRFVGQDARRGTFAQRHAVFHDRINGQEWLPLLNLSEDQAKFWIYDSLLSEYAALAFEYGYSLQREEALVLWEAQFGDFADGAQSVIDTYISSSEQKWGQRSSVVLLLPHGLEGQGPDHSSARIERYLQLCAQENMIVAQPSTPANYFHLLQIQCNLQDRRVLLCAARRQSESEMSLLD
jgi:2-oxoglutarate dehydrogenase E1 component